MTRPPFTPAAYWDVRYRQGRDSGAGSRGEVGETKAAHVNAVISRWQVRSVIDWGCGDGQVLTHLTDQVDYLGVDVSPTILAKVAGEHPGRRFCLPEAAAGEQADMALSMDVLFHFPDDADYRAYLAAVFGSAERLVLIYSTNDPGGRTAYHVNRRCFTPDIVSWYPQWELVEPPESLHEDEAAFFLYGRDVIR